VTLAATTVPAGSYVVIGTVTGLRGPIVFAGDPQQFGFLCELRDANDNFVGGASVVGGDSPNVHEAHSLAITGGTFAPEGQTQTIRIQCKIGLPGQDDVEGAVDGAQLVVLQIGGFF
jgi:hypothetical protein